MTRTEGYRQSGRHWAHLSGLLHALERCVIAAARLDASRTRPEYDQFGVEAEDGRAKLHSRVQAYAAVDRRMDELARQIDQEIDRLTVARLTQTLTARQTRDARWARQDALVDESKICLDCQRPWPRRLFGKDRTKADGRQPYCMACWKIRYARSTAAREARAS